MDHPRTRITPPGTQQRAQTTRGVSCQENTWYSRGFQVNVRGVRCHLPRPRGTFYLFGGISGLATRLLTKFDRFAAGPVPDHDVSSAFDQVASHAIPHYAKP